ncbi:hypothetical protein C8A01DRAFT_40203 [Parachaetomium inaequale]|uniref:Myb-like domain-containing protein n=1 Tax=Parachaetomium inaequale TaxID=2588326 RepID=A0AAN6P7V8_9PEZI|nr:hypothetical protein C8A01DRAFT_40203 [Parachaetomium inaequale]
MFISPDRPQVDMVSLQDNVFSFAAPDFAPWLSQLSQINAALFLHQQRLHDMSFNRMSLKSGWPQLAAKPEPHGLPACGSGYYPEGQNTTAGEGQSLPGNHTSRSAISFVSHYATSAELRGVAHPSNANVPVAPELLDSSFWPVVPHGPAALPPFAHGDPTWEHTHQGVNPSVFDYGHYNLGVHTSVLPDTVFRPGEALQNLSLPPMPDRDSSTSSKLYASSDMLEAMVLDDEPDQSWNTSPGTPAGYGGSRCVEVSESDITSSTWAKSERIDEKTVSPNMLKIRQTPTPSSSYESIHTSFLADAHLPEPLVVVNPIPTQAPRLHGTAKKARKLLPDISQRLLLPSNHISRHQQHPAYARSPSPAPRKLTRLRPKSKRDGTPSLPSPPPACSPAMRTQLPAAVPKRGPAKEREPEPVDLSDRTSKDDFLVKQKQLGMTYKEIRRKGGFTEAESTLRGRYRTLTKVREARVRKPEWAEKDLRLLEKAVRSLSHTSNLNNSSKVPWKKVAEYIVAHGGSYHFGNSTCRKRWDDLVREQTALGKTLRQPFFEMIGEFAAGAVSGGGHGYGQGV